MRQERMQESLKQRQKNRDDPKSSGSTSSRPNEISINSLHPSSGNGNLTLDLNHDSCKNILIALYLTKPEGWQNWCTPYIPNNLSIALLHIGSGRHIVFVLFSINKKKISQFLLKLHDKI